MNSGKLVETLEFYPEEGIYHYDGHRACGICFSPEQTKKHKGICPKCGKPLTIGVMNRVEELADRLEKDIHSQTKFTTVIPLQDVIAESLGVNKHSKRVQSIYEEMVARGQSEFNVLLNLNEKELCLIGAPRIAEAILRVRRGQVKLVPALMVSMARLKFFPKKKEKNRGNYYKNRQFSFIFSNQKSRRKSGFLISL
jgi:PHP family Zn ribbon phosphoesterase